MITRERFIELYPKYLILENTNLFLTSEPPYIREFSEFVVDYCKEYNKNPNIDCMQATAMLLYYNIEAFKIILANIMNILKIEYVLNILKDKNNNVIMIF